MKRFSLLRILKHFLCLFLVLRALQYIIGDFSRRDPIRDEAIQSESCPNGDFVERHICPDCGSAEEAWEFVRRVRRGPRLHYVVVPLSTETIANSYRLSGEHCISTDKKQVYNCDKAKRTCEDLGLCDVSHLAQTGNRTAATNCERLWFDEFSDSLVEG